MSLLASSQVCLVGQRTYVIYELVIFCQFQPGPCMRTLCRGETLKQLYRRFTKVSVKYHIDNGIYAVCMTQKVTHKLIWPLDPGQRKVLSNEEINKMVNMQWWIIILAFWRVQIIFRTARLPSFLSTPRTFGMKSAAHKFKSHLNNSLQFLESLETNSFQICHAVVNSVLMFSLSFRLAGYQCAKSKE